MHFLALECTVTGPLKASDLFLLQRPLPVNPIQSDRQIFSNFKFGEFDAVGEELWLGCDWRIG